MDQGPGPSKVPAEVESKMDVEDQEQVAETPEILPAKKGIKKTVPCEYIIIYNLVFVY